MPRLVHPDAGTVVRCEGDLAAHYLSQGWVDADAAARPVEATPEKPQVRRTRKSRS